MSSSRSWPMSQQIDQESITSSQSTGSKVRMVQSAVIAYVDKKKERALPAATSSTKHLINRAYWKEGRLGPRDTYQNLASKNQHSKGRVILKQLKRLMSGEWTLLMRCWPVMSHIVWDHTDRCSRDGSSSIFQLLQPVRTSGQTDGLTDRLDRRNHSPADALYRLPQRRTRGCCFVTKYIFRCCKLALSVYNCVHLERGIHCCTRSGLLVKWPLTFWSKDVVLLGLGPLMYLPAVLVLRPSTVVTALTLY